MNHMPYRIRAPFPNDIRCFQAPALLAAVVLVGSNAFVLSPILPVVARGLATETFHIAWAISAFGAATAVSALILGGLIDRMPAGRVLGGAALLLAVAQMLSGLSQSWIGLCSSQALAGVATGVLLPGVYATATATAPPGREAARLGVVLTGWALSLVVTVPLAALITVQSGWRTIYTLLAAMSVLIALALRLALRKAHGGTVARTPPWRALRLPGVPRLLVAMFAYMTAFYGSFAFLLAYGLGFGVAGLGLSLIVPRISQGYIILTLIVIATSYASWRFALAWRPVAFAAAIVWGGLNQLALNALIVSLNRHAAEAYGAVMGLNSAVTYSAVFAGPAIMSPIYIHFGFPGVSDLAAIFVLIGAAVSGRVR
jgi:predicted MFS family arabinose efflux permease